MPDKKNTPMVTVHGAIRVALREIREMEPPTPTYAFTDSLKKQGYKIVPDPNYVRPCTHPAMNLRVIAPKMGTSERIVRCGECGSEAKFAF